ncbi:MAG: hypothetical protein NC817_01745 [Candidatus Omnitrophica bacterium]|nr:hypothetical protein [Candidatus Omnitrophota bacterium]MCM8824394.1 hypothetical protein [Candidatus Omnitrophota bacterium]MCM8825973.1 hypothetical protein [Candidatus Omnitrophota bacterium]
MSRKIHPDCEIDIDYNRGDAFLMLAKVTLGELFYNHIVWLKDRKI